MALLFSLNVYHSAFYGYGNRNIVFIFSNTTTLVAPDRYSNKYFQKDRGTEGRLEKNNIWWKNNTSNKAEFSHFVLECLPNNQMI